ncbi:MAG: hypothetical protein ACTSUD_12000, partial [Alphaproteobacteria bacterium]
MSAGGAVALLLSAALVGAVVYHTGGRRNWGGRRVWLALGTAGVLLIAGFAGGWSMLVGYRADEPLLPIAGYVDALVDWLVTDYGDVLRERISNPVVYGIGYFERFLHAGVAWPLMALLFAGLAYHASRRIGLALFVAASFILIWSL